MIFYILLQVVLLSLVLYSFKQKFYKKIAVFYAVLFLVAISVVRYGIGIDFFSYQDNYLVIINGEFLKAEYGFIILSQLSSYLGFGFQGVVATYAIVTIALIISFYSRFSNNLLLSIYIFTMMPILYLSSFNVMRQFLAVAIFAFSIKFIFEKKLMTYIGCILFAVIFVHKSALLMLPMYFLLRRNLSVITYIALTFLYIISMQFLDFVVLAMGFSAIYLDTYTVNVGLNPLVFIYFSIFIFILYLKNKLINHKPENIIFINLMFLCTLVYFTPLFSNLPSILFMRLTTFFTIAIPIIMVNVLPVIKNYRTRLVYFLGMIFATTLYFYITLILKGDISKLTPYNTFIFN